MTAHVTLDLQRACDLACGYCTVRGVDGGTAEARAQRAAHAARTAIAQGARHVTLTGGEPSLEPWLPALVAGLHRAGAHVTLQTHGLLSEVVVGRLAQAGLQRATVACNSLNPLTLDALAGRPNTWPRLFAGVRRLLDAGIGVDLASVVLPENAAELPSLVQQAAHKWPAGQARLGALHVRPLQKRKDASPLLSPQALAGTLTAVAVAARAPDALPVIIDPGFELPPCAYDDAQRQTCTRFLRIGPEIVAREAQRYQRIAACAQCALQDACPGVAPAWSGALADVAPVTNAAHGYGIDTLSDRAMPVHAALQLANTQRLRGDAAPVTASGAPWPQVSAGSWDREAWEVHAGLRRVLRREVGDAVTARAVATALQAAGLAVEPVEERAGHTLAARRWTVWAGQSSDVVAAAVRLDATMATQHRAQPDAGVQRAWIAELGDLLGYPRCCVAAFCDDGDNGDARQVQLRAAAQQKPLRPEQNWAVVPLRWMSHLPCSPDCAATSARVAAVRAHVDQHFAPWAAAMRTALASPVAAWSYERFVGFYGADWHSATTLSYRAAFGLDAFGDADPLLQRHSWRLFAREVLTPLRAGNRLVLQGPRWQVLADDVEVATLDFAGLGPPLLRFDGA